MGQLKKAHDRFLRRYKMAECPAGYELRVALGGLTCKSCGYQCMIRYLNKKIKELESKIGDVEDGVEDLEYETSKLKRRS
jgi:hypothetical protein